MRELELEARVTASDGEIVSAPATISVGTTVVTIPDTIPGADMGDQSAAIQAFLDAAGDGVAIHVPRLFRFDAAGPRFVHRRGIRLFGEGGFTTPTDGYDVPPTPGHTHGWPRTRDRLKLEGCDDFTVEGILLEGSNQANLEERGYVEELEGQHGIDVGGCRRLTIAGVRVRFVRGDWIYLGGGTRYDGTKGWSEDILVRDNELSYNGRQGFGITGVARAAIRGNKTHYCRRTTIDLEANGPNGGAIDLSIIGNAFGRGHLTWLTIHRTGILERIVVQDNTVEKANLITPLNAGSRIKGLRLARNVSSVSLGNPQGAAWRIQGVDGLEVFDNRIFASAGRDMHLMALQDCTGVDAAPEAQAFALDGTPLPLIRPESWYFDADGLEHGTPPVA